MNLADKLTAKMGTWAFVLWSIGFILIWAIGNVIILCEFDIRVDPYPFTFLNLILSTIAAIQAPIIMISQKKQDQKLMYLIDKIDAEEQEEIKLLNEVLREIKGKGF